MTSMLVAAVLAFSVPGGPGTRVWVDPSLNVPNYDVQELSNAIAARSSPTLGVVVYGSLDLDPKGAAMATLNTWGMGPQSALILISFSPRKIYIQPGDGMASALDQATSEHIARDVIAPRLKRGDLKGGIVAGLLEISSRTVTHSTPYPATAPVVTYSQPSGAFRSVPAPSFVDVQPVPHETHWFLWLLAILVVVALVTWFIRWLMSDNGAYISAGPRAYRSYGGGAVMSQASNTNVIVNEVNNGPTVVPFSTPSYSPPAPTYTPPADDGGSSGIGGGGADWSSGSSFDFGGGGGGGSSFDSGGGGSGFDSGSSGGGGGGADW